MPWEDIVRLCKKYGVMSLVDAAHAIGQMKIDVKRAEPDFLVTVGVSAPFVESCLMLPRRTVINGSWRKLTRLTFALVLTQRIKDIAGVPFSTSP